VCCRCGVAVPGTGRSWTPSRPTTTRSLRSARTSASGRRCFAARLLPGGAPGPSRPPPAKAGQHVVNWHRGRWGPQCALRRHGGGVATGHTLPALFATTPPPGAGTQGMPCAGISAGWLGEPCSLLIATGRTLPAGHKLASELSVPSSDVTNFSKASWLTAQYFVLSHTYVLSFSPFSFKLHGTMPCFAFSHFTLPNCALVHAMQENICERTRN